MKYTPPLIPAMPAKTAMAMPAMTPGDRTEELSLEVAERSCRRWIGKSNCKRRGERVCVCACVRA